jgi:hypothetical protein
MKNIFLLLCGLVLLGACKKNDDEPAPVKPLTFNETEITIAEAKVVDFGKQGEHYNYDFFLTDGSLNEENAPSADATFYIYAELLSPGISDFKPGLFTYSQEPLAGHPYFETVMVATDSNADGTITAEDEIIPATGGQIEVEGTGLNYTLSFDLQLLNGHTLSGSYTNEFTYESQR